jgi:hypothetical protein
MFIPPRPRVRIEDKGYELQIEIPPRRDAATIAPWVFMTGWLVGWLMGEVFAGSMVIMGLMSLLSPRPTVLGEALPAHGPGGFALIFVGGWLIAWTAGGLMAIHHWLHLMWGRELITVDGNRLAILSLPLARRREYSAPDISGMTVSTDALQQTRQWRNPQRSIGGAITFTYGGQQHSFGATLDPAEAEQIISEIGRRYKWMVGDTAPGETHD